MRKKYIPFSCLPLNIIGLRPSSRLCLSHIMHELFATGCEETMFNIVLNMHELFDGVHTVVLCVVLVAQTWVVCVGFLKDHYFSFLFWSFHCVSFFDLLLLFILWRLQAFHISLTILFSIYSKEGHAEMLTKIFLCNLKLIHDEVIFSPRGHKWNLITMKNNMSRTKKKILEKES